MRFLKTCFLQSNNAVTITTADVCYLQLVVLYSDGSSSLCFSYKHAVFPFRFLKKFFMPTQFQREYSHFHALGIKRFEKKLCNFLDLVKEKRIV